MKHVCGLFSVKSAELQPINFWSSPADTSRGRYVQCKRKEAADGAA
jgi:hypothetical protein